jgi:aminoglycoside 6'-N-acetyltransferase I
MSADPMQIVDLANQSDSMLEQAALLLVEEFNAPHGWPTIEKAREEVASVVREGFARAVVEGGVLVGWVGGLPEYHGRVWELHPIVVRREHRRRGIGRALVAAFEEEACKRGALTATLGTDDDSGMTSLADADLYRDVPRHIVELRDLGRGHPFLFYRKLGYVVTGVMPDANGRGRPDIYMSKRLLAPDTHRHDPGDGKRPSGI